MRPAENPRLAIRLLHEAATALERVGVTVWLTDGTLLGAIREHTFIAHDADMDLGAHITEYTADVIPALKATGFTIYRTLGTIKTGLEHKLDRDGMRIDIFWHYDKPRHRGVWHAAWQGRKRITYHYERLVLERTTLLGHTFWAPTPPRLHLAAKYGPAWRTPIEDWDWARDPANAREET